MKLSEIIPQDERQNFWAVVEKCIEEFHPSHSASALAKRAELQKKVERMPVAQAAQFYHSEPFDVACNLADEPLSVEHHQKRYLEIRDGAGD